MPHVFSPSPIQKKIIQFFHRHPNAIETARGIASWLTVDSHSIQEAVDDLVVWKWLTVHQAAAVVGYALTENERILAQIREVLKVF